MFTHDVDSELQRVSPTYPVQSVTALKVSRLEELRTSGGCSEASVTRRTKRRNARADAPRLRLIFIVRKPEIGVRDIGWRAIGDILTDEIETSLEIVQQVWTKDMSPA